MFIFALSSVFLALSTASQVPILPFPDYASHARDAFVVLQKWYNNTTGLWDSTGWWNSANCLTTVGDLAALDGMVRANISQVFSNTFVQAQNHNLQMIKVIQDDFSVKTLYGPDFSSVTMEPPVIRPKGFLNAYYDDEGWWALGWIQAYDVTHDTRYLSAAMDIFEDMKNGSTSPCGTGIWWNRYHTYVNAITNELFLSIASHLANRVVTNKQYYLDTALTHWQWFQDSGMINSENLINDGLTMACVNNHATVWSYNQGVILGALVELSTASQNRSYITTAKAIATAAINALTDSAGVLHDPCEPHCDADASQFKGVFMRNLQILQQAAPEDNFLRFIATNADSVWKSDRNTENQLGLVWSGPFISPDASTHSSALDALVAAVAFQDSLENILDPAGPSDDHGMNETREQEPHRGENASRMDLETVVSLESDFTASSPARSDSFFQKAKKWIKIYAQFIGPGFMISVAYIDPGNYSTDVTAGASYQFKLLFIVLVSNVIAIYLQSLCIKLGTITGMDLAQMCRVHLPRWLNIFLYLMAEGAIIATDIAEVIGTAIAINVLIPQISLVAGCAISILDVFLTLLFYRPNGTMRDVRIFEFFVAALVFGVVICFWFQLSLIKNISVGEVFRGYLPSSAVLESNGIYQACGILGATVMPHSLYLGSGIVQPRLIDYDETHGHRIPPAQMDSQDSRSSHSTEYIFYRPSLAAIKHCMKYSIIELGISLSTFALFVNSAILIVAGASLYGNDDAQDASLFSIYDLLSSSIAPAAGTIFALALLLSGMSAGIVCTIAGQMVSEGALKWTIAPWIRRLITRSIAITPSIIIAGVVGKEGLDDVLIGSQVGLSVALPFISAPLIYFTALNKYMTVQGNKSSAITEDDVDEELQRLLGAEQPANEGTKMGNHWIVTVFAVILWLIVAVMNVANLVLLQLGH